MNPLAAAITRTTRTLSVRLEPVRVEAKAATYRTVDLRRTIDSLRPHLFTHREADQIVWALRRAIAGTPDGATETVVRTSGLLTLNLHFARLANAVERAQKISRGIIPGALSAREAHQLAARHFGGRL